MIIVTITVLLLIFILWFARRFEKHGADKVVETVTVSNNRIRAGEYIEYVLQIQNIKLLILPVINAIITIPYSFSCEINSQIIGRKEENNLFRTIKVTTSLLSYQQVKQRFSLKANERGYYEIKTILSAQDLLGMKNIHIADQKIEKIIVHPLAVDYSFTTYDAKSIQGDQLVRRWSNPDPIFYSGVREYTERDSLKDIDWKASARQNTLLVKKYDTTSDMSFMYLIMTHRGNRYELDYYSYIEAVISSVTYMMQLNEYMDIPYAMNTNLSMRNSMNVFHMSDIGVMHMTEQLDALACATYIPDYTPVAYLEDKIEHMSKNTTLVFFYYMLEEDDVLMLNGLMKMGFTVKVIFHKESDVHVMPQIEALLFKGGEIHE